MVPSIGQVLQQAIEAHKRGRLQEAERLYRSILKAVPRHAAANYNLGVLAVGVGKPEAALPFLEIAVEAEPQQAQFSLGYADALIQANQVDSARQLLERARQSGVASTAIDELLTILQTERRPDDNSGRLLTAAEVRYQQGVVARRRSPYLDYPAHVHLETLALCNAACSFCPYPTLARKGEKMSDGLIEKIISDLEDIPRDVRFQISPFKVNEPFLDVRLFDLLDRLKARLPNADLTLTTNASPITERTLDRLAKCTGLTHLWISFNDHRQDAYERVMALPYDRTMERLRLIHRKKAEGSFTTHVVLSRVGDGTSIDGAFREWVNTNFPLFASYVFARGEWLGQIATAQSSLPPNIGCTRWFDLSITATGVVAHCCMDGKAEHPIGDASSSHLLEIYNRPAYRKLREETLSRLDVDPCRRCNFL